MILPLNKNAFFSLSFLLHLRILICFFYQSFVSLFYVSVLFSTHFEKPQIVLFAVIFHIPIPQFTQLAFQICLIAKQNSRHIVRQVLIKFFQPILCLFDCFIISDIEDYKDSIGLSKKISNDCFKLLLSCRVPQFYQALFAVDSLSFGSVVHTDCGYCALLEGIFKDSHDDWCLSDFHVPDNTSFQLFGHSYFFNYSNRSLFAFLWFKIW